MLIRRLAFIASFVVFQGCATEIVAPLPPNAVQVFPVIETDYVNNLGDAADDPAVWVHPIDVNNSLVIGTDKGFGIEVYNLAGERVQSIAAGRTNNIDLRYVSGLSNVSAIAAASNRSRNTISLFSISNDGSVVWLEGSEIDTGLSEPYGLCMYQSDLGLQVFVNDTDGRYQQWLLMYANAQADQLALSAELIREFKVPSQPEGCVADDEQGLLFLGVEAEGVRVIQAAGDAPLEFFEIANVDQIILAADVEGMGLYKDGEGGYLVVSSQGNYSYAVYDRKAPHNYRGSFYVGDNLELAVDGSQETDGLEINSALRTEQFPNGIVVVQDGFNTLPTNPQNFKYISWDSIAAALDL